MSFLDRKEEHIQRAKADDTPDPFLLRMNPFLELLMNAEDWGAVHFLSSSHFADTSNLSQSAVASVLRETCQSLVQRLANLVALDDQIHLSRKITPPPSLVVMDVTATESYNNHRNEPNQSTSITNTASAERGSMPRFHAAETVWAQIELYQRQSNPSLQRRLAKSINELTRAAATTSDSASTSDPPGKYGSGDANSRAASSGSLIRLLEEEEKIEIEGDASDADEDADYSDGNDNEEDSMTKRMRLRMEKVMSDAEEQKRTTETRIIDENDNDHENEDEMDPAIQELNDGIFDVCEMRAFADEEEEYLPDATIAAMDRENIITARNNIKKRSFHQRQRDGDAMDERGENDIDDVGDERDDPYVHRRKYRDDEDIDALYKLYEKPGHDDDDDDDDNDKVINLTALDLFGRPNPKYFHKWNNQSSVPTLPLQSTQSNHKSKEKGLNLKDDHDDDSWNEYDFTNDPSKDELGDSWNTGLSNSEVSNNNVGDGGSEDACSVNIEEQHDSGGSSTFKMQLNDSKSQRMKRSKSYEKLALQTKQLEEEMIAEKPWQMKGETTSTSRPVNSLLTCTPAFEVASKLTPTLTIEHTEAVEDMIKRRIVNEDWDDVIPRELPDVGWNRKRNESPEVSQEKSKLSLGELYEREYLKKVVGYDADASEKASEEDKAKEEIRSLFANLCSKLDALSNYHFAPRPVAEEAEVRVITKPAIAIEEVLPLHVSDSRASAPQELYAGKRGRDGVLRSESELEQSDRKRLRSIRKAARRKERQAKLVDEKLITRLQPGLGLNNPYEKRKVRQELQASRAVGKVSIGQLDANDNYGDSGTFFKRLQQDAERSVRGEKIESVTKKPKSPSKKESNSIKL